MTKKYFSSMCLLFTCLLFSAHLLRAQTAPAARQVIKGKVVDKKTKEAIIGASVILVDKDKRTLRGASTDIEGNYSLPVPDPTLRIIVQYLGYKTTDPITVGDKTVMNFQIESSSTQMQDLVITGKAAVNNGLMNIDTRDLTTAVTTIQAKDLEEMQAASIDQALQGRMPGVDISTTSGDPGAPMQIRIRGTSSLNQNSQPLIVVDGMPYEVNIPSDFNFSTSDETGYGQLLNISPADIKEITVLRDVASTAIWGSRGANGVLMINTKRGTIGKPTLNYVFKGSVLKQPPSVPTLNGDQYSSLILEEYYNAGRAFSTNENAKQFQYDPNDPYNYYNFSNNTNWLDVVTRLGITQNHSFALSGGGERARYRVSVTTNNNKGTTKGTSLSNLNSLINLDYTVSNRIVFQTSVTYAHIDYDNVYGSTGDIRSKAYTKMPNQSVYEYDEFGNLTSNYFNPLTTAQGNYPGTYNPLAMAEAGVNNQIGDRITPKFTLRYAIKPNVLTLQGQLQFDVNNSKTNTFLPQIATGRPYTENTVNVAGDSDQDRFAISSRVTLNYTPNIGERQTLVSSLVFSSDDDRTSSQGISSTNSASSYLQDPSIPARVSSVGYTASQSRNVSANLATQYSLLDRYLLNVTVRGEGSSKFSAKNRYSLYPTVSTRWRISSEPFMKKFSGFLDDLSIRVGRAMNGRAPGDNYGFYNNYQSYGFSYLGETGVYATNMELTNLKWESKVETNVGFNLDLFKGRFTSQLDIYNNRTKDQITNLQIPTYNGYNSGITTNFGTIDNRGIEFIMNARPLKTKDWSIDMNFNISRNQNVIRELSRLTPRENGAKITTNGAYKAYVQENNPFGSFYGFKFKGVYPDKSSTIAKDPEGNPILDPAGNPIYMRFGYPTVDYQFQAGDSMYEDINFDGVIDYKDVVYLGNGNPTFIGGGGATFGYKGKFTLLTFFTFRTGNDIVNGTRMNTTSMYNFNNQSTAVLRRWKKEGDITDMPRALYQAGYNYLGSSRYVEDGSFIRLRTVTGRYTFDRNFIQKLRMKSLQMYVTAENLLTFTKYTGQDPDAAPTSAGMFSVATDNSTTPPAKTFTFGLNVTF